MIDASHANCSKDYNKMPGVFEEIVAQRAEGDKHVIGAMLESNLEAGNQSLNDGIDKLTYGKSITDPCIEASRIVGSKTCQPKRPPTIERSFASP